jgi:chromosomal replication initiation ATPase DnaA
MAHIEEELKALMKLTRINYKDVIDSSPYTFKELQGKSRKTDIRIWRQFLVAFGRLQGMTITDSGSLVNQDHSTVIHAVYCLNSRLRSNQYPEYLEVLNTIKYHIQVNISSSEDMNINEMNCLILLDHLISKKYANIN